MSCRIRKQEAHVEEPLNPGLYSFSPKVSKLSYQCSNRKIYVRTARESVALGGTNFLS